MIALFFESMVYIIWMVFENVAPKHTNHAQNLNSWWLSLADLEKDSIKCHHESSFLTFNDLDTKHFMLCFQIWHLRSWKSLLHKWPNHCSSCNWHPLDWVYFLKIKIHLIALGIVIKIKGKLTKIFYVNLPCSSMHFSTELL